MIYVHYSKWGISLTVQKEEPGPLTQKEVEQTIMSAIDLSLENGENPYDQTKKSDLTMTWEAPVILPYLDQNKLNDPQQKKKLTRWIMQTDQMQEALNLFKSSEDLITEEVPEEAGMMDLSCLIQEIIPVEADYQ